MPYPKIAVVLPAYNEAERIERAVEEVRKELSSYYAENEFEIIIAEDGSTDGTDKIAAELAEKYANVRHLHSGERLGKGRAIAQAFMNSNAEILVFMDVDLSTDLKHLKELIQAVEEGYDFATGSRLMAESETDRPLKRDFASKAYNFLVRLFLGSRLHDHQCGFKAFRREALFEIVDKARDTHWFWDTEILVLAQREGYRVKEIPVKWEGKGETKVRARDSLYMLSSILKFWWGLKVER
ncbi:MAG: glycosyltransferase family 2 protein [Archaeoglobus sp.]|nr:glycosyltransferase family 2 protein [Archaeoglobus sp.]